MTKKRAPIERFGPRAGGGRLAGAGGERLRAAGLASDPPPPAGAGHSGRKLRPPRSLCDHRPALASRGQAGRAADRLSHARFFSRARFSSTRSRAATPMRPASTSVTPIMARCSCARNADGATRSRTSSSTVCCRKRRRAPALLRIGRWSSLWACAGTARGRLIASKPAFQPKPVIPGNGSQNQFRRHLTGSCSF